MTAPQFTVIKEADIDKTSKPVYFVVRAPAADTSKFEQVLGGYKGKKDISI